MDVPVTVSSRGQIVIPVNLRKKYGITANSKIEFVDTGEEIVLVTLPENPFEDSYGSLKGVTTKDLFEARRKERISEKKKGKPSGHCRQFHHFFCL